MKNSRYSVTVIIRIVMICANCFLLIWLYMNTDRPATTLFVFFFLIFQTGSLIFYHNRISRDLANFLVFLEENDTTLAFSRKRIERSFSDVVYQLNRINEKLQHARLERERQFQYLQAVIKQIDTGIIAFDQDGKVELFNQAAREMLGVRSIKHIDELVDKYPETAGFVNSLKKSISPLRLKVNEKEYILAVKLGSIRFDQRTVKLISFQNIKPELEARELDAWRKLIRIQRHEIINSITPITTLTTAIKRRFLQDNRRKDISEITDEHIDDALKSVEVIEERSHGLIEFIERFKGLTDVPSIKSGQIHLKKLVENLVVLFSRDLNAKSIRFITDIKPEDLVVKGDEKLLDQAMINLIKNSIEAIDCYDGVLLVKAFRDNMNGIIIQVIDNGTGIDKTSFDSLFVPSFSTKEKGSGIGLSITRQIIQLHKGTIEVRSDPGIETVFEITLPAEADIDITNH